MVDTQQHFCPAQECTYYGWTGRGNIRANGHPGGKPWRQLQCVSCHGFFQETHGTPLQGKRVDPQALMWAVGALAEGLGIRAVARGFAVALSTVLQWLVEVADHAAAFSRSFLHDVRVPHVQLDELFTLLNAVKAGEVSEAKAVTRVSRAAHWVWVAIDPVTNRHGLGQVMAILYTSHSGRIDRSCVEPERPAPLPRAAVAPAPSAVQG